MKVSNQDEKTKKEGGVTKQEEIKKMKEVIPGTYFPSILLFYHLLV